MNMISELRRRVSTTGTATLTVDEYNQLQREWITRTGAEDMVAAERERCTGPLLQLLVDCDAVQAGGNPNEQGLCDAVDNDGCHYQSAALAGWLEVAHKAGIRPMLRLEEQPNTPAETRQTAQKETP